MTRVLRVDQGDIAKIASEVGCTSRYVSLALKGAANTVLTRKARALAIVKYHAKVMHERELTPKERLEELAIEEQYGVACE